MLISDYLKLRRSKKWDRYEMVLPGRIKTWNKFAFSSRFAYLKYRDGVYSEMNGFFLQHYTKFKPRPYFLGPVQITFTIGFGTMRRPDIDSICVKPYVDSLVMEGVLEEDSPNYVRKVIFQWENTPQDQTKILIESVSLPS